ncbi:glucosyltransferase domain-containing protein, partial [Enterococcus hirae]|nr:glucosyltransferase domain-containing protein [Enterococcus hirae]
LKRAFSAGYVNIYILNFLTLTFHLFSCLLICFLVQQVTKLKDSSFKLFIIPAIYMTHPYFTVQFYFVLQSFEFALGVCLTVIADLLIFFSFKNQGNRWIKYIIAVFLLLISFSIYQSLIPFFIAVTISIILLYVITSPKMRISLKSYFQFILPYIFVFIAGLISSQILNKVMMSIDHVTKTEYLSGRIVWGEKPLSEILHSIGNGIFSKVFPTSAELFITPFLGIELCLLVVVLIVMIIKRTPHTLLTTFHLSVFFITPFAILILQGGTVVNPHSQVPTYPYVLAILLLTLFLLVDSKLKIMTYLLTTMTICFLFLQTRSTSNVLFSDQMKFEEDIRMTERIIGQIDSLQLKNQNEYSIILIGAQQSKNLFNQPKDMMGLSIYMFGSFAPMSISNNVYGFMSTLGYQFQQPTEEQYNQVKDQAKEMDIFPSGGGIKVIDKIIVIKLS